MPLACSHSVAAGCLLGVSLGDMKSEIKTTLVGMSIVGGFVGVLGILSVFFFLEMTQNSFQGASTKYGPKFPSVPAADITKAAQCLDAYDKKWVGCTKLGQ